MPFSQHPSSYRDPSGFLFSHNGILYRQINNCFREDFEKFISSGLYQHLVQEKLLIPHQTIHQNFTGTNEWYETIQPEFIPFISYPYEWCFDMLKDAALTTIEAAKEAMKFGMLLKDASAYNLQWHKGKMMFIDSLSFENYDEQKPWIAYRQFCEHFLSPLSLMYYLKEPLQNLMIAYPDGIPLSITKKLLPKKTRFKLNIFLHLHLHANIAEKKSIQTQKEKPFSKTKLNNLLRSLEETVDNFSFQIAKKTWSDYYEEANQREDYVQQKKQIINDWINQMPINTAIDLGSNEGEFSELLANKNIYTISADVDHYSINKLYNKIKRENKSNIHPLIIDLSNPSPALGVNNEERTSFLHRAKADVVLALALVHHLAIGKNIPFDLLAQMFQKMSKNLIIEFIPKEDKKIQLMLQQKKDVYHWYSQENFLNAFSLHYKIKSEKEIGSSRRILYLMQSDES